MSRAVLALAVVSCTVPALEDLGALVCNATHPCPAALQCVAERCVASSAAGGGAAGGGVANGGGAAGAAGGAAPCDPGLVGIDAVPALGGAGDAVMAGGLAVAASGMAGELRVHRVDPETLLALDILRFAMPELVQLRMVRLAAHGDNLVSAAFAATALDGGEGVYYLPVNVADGGSPAAPRLLSPTSPFGNGGVDVAGTQGRSMVMWNDSLGYNAAVVDPSTGQLLEPTTAVPLPLSAQPGPVSVTFTPSGPLVGTRGFDGGAQFYTLGMAGLAMPQSLLSSGGMIGPFLGTTPQGVTVAAWLGRTGMGPIGAVFGSPSTGSVLEERPFANLPTGGAGFDTTVNAVLAAPHMPAFSAFTVCQLGVSSCRTVLGGAPQVMAVAPLSLGGPRALVFVWTGGGLWVHRVCL